MKLNEFAETLGIEISKAILAAQLAGLDIDFDTELTDNQIGRLETALESKQSIGCPQLLGQSESRQPQQEFQEQIVPIEEQAPVLLNDATDIASIQQNAVTQASAARQAQEEHVLQTRLQQASEDGLYEGVVTGLTREHSRIKGLMLVTDAAFQSEAAQREKHGELMASLLGENSDFLTQYQGAAQTYSETAKVGATSSPNIMQVINNLRNS